jgi:hypothetical protein
MRGMNTLPPTNQGNEPYNPFAPNSFQAPAETLSPFAQNPFEPTSTTEDNPFAPDRPASDYPPEPLQPTIGNNPFSNNPFSAAETVMPTTQESLTNYQTARLSERLREKARPVMELGKRAVRTLVQLAPRITEKVKTAYNSDYGQKVAGMARDAAGETAMTVALSGARSLGERFGVGYENGELSVKKTKLARGAIRFALNPHGESVKAVKAASKEAYHAGRREARSQAFTAGATVANDAFGYARGRF